MSDYNYAAHYAQQQQQGQQAQTSRYYSGARPAATASTQYPAQTTTASSQQQYSQSPAYGTYNNRNSYDSSTSGQAYSGASASQPHQYPQSQSVNRTPSYQHARATPQNTGASHAYHQQQQIRQNSSTPTNPVPRAQYQAPSQSQPSQTSQHQQRYETSQRRTSPHSSYQQRGSNQYSSVRGEVPQRNNASYQTTSDTSGHITVDPSQVYDNSHERRRQLAEAEAAQRAKEAEEARRAEELRKAEEARKEEEDRRAAEAEQERAAAEVRRLADAGAKKKAGDGKKKQASKGQEGGTSRSRKKGKTSENMPSDENQMQAAAMTLMQTANSGGDQTALEIQMKEMFRKMRELNQKDPEMLSRLWQQERDDHLAKEVGSTPAAVTPSATQAARTSGTPAGSSTKQKQSKKPKSNVAVNNNQPQSSYEVASPSAPTAATLSPTITPNPDTAASSTAANARSRGTVWPADKKAVIAEAASDLLKTMAGNNGRTLPASAIAKLLDGNPRYEQLCDSIESQGVKVDRSSFAKALLTAVPDVNKKKPIQPSHGTDPQPSSIEQSSEQTLLQAEKRLLKGANLVAKKPGRPARESDVVADIKSRKPLAEVSGGLTQGSPSTPQLDASQPIKVFVDGQWVEPVVGPSPKSVKEKKSHKTQQPKAPIDTGPPTKQDQARKRDFGELIDLSQQLSDDDDPFTPWNPPAKRLHIGDGTGADQLPTPPDTVAEGPILPAISGLAAVQQHNRQSGFSISTNQLPNSSSMTQSQTSGAPVAPIGVNDLSKSQLPPIKAIPVPGSNLPRDHPARRATLVQNLDKRKALRRSTYDIRTIARDVLIACGRHPDMRHLNAHLEALKSVSASIDTTSDLSTFRWDLVDPGGPAPGSGIEPVPQPTLPIDVDADDEDSDNDSVLGPAATTARQVVGTTGYQTFSAFDMQPRGTKKLGRPRMSEPGVQSHGVGAQRGRPRHSEGPPRTSNFPATPSTGAGAYAALREQNAAGTGEPKKRGRPVGWRKWMMADPGAYKGSAENRTSGKKKKSPSPQFQVFKCEWNGCTAELHNLVTLRAHVFKLHGKTNGEGKFDCHWKDCHKIINVTNSATGKVQPRIMLFSYDDLDSWKGHIEEKHITPIAWKLGDGPKGGVSDNYESEVSESYMSDAQGRRITPRAVPPDDNEPARKRTAAEKEAEQTLREAEQRKRDIGPSVDRGGATFVTDKQRKDFQDDEDTAMVVDDDDDA